MLRTLGSVLAVLLFATPLAAQAPRKGIAEVVPSHRGGFWASLGFGAGMEKVDVDGDALGYSDQFWRPTVNVRMGGTLGQQVRLGGEVFVWINEQGDLTETLVSVMPIVQLYPVASTGLHLRGGAGWARSGVTDFYGYNVGNNGFGTMVGIGWELPVGRKVFLTPAVDWNQQWYDGGRDPGYTERVINFGLSIGFQTR